MRIKLPYMLLFIFLAFASCSGEEAAPLPTEMKVSFAVGAENTTRATTENVPAGRTARVLVYLSESGATQPDFTRKLVGESTYYFDASGYMKRCTVDASGLFSTGDVTGGHMSLPLFSQTDPGHFDIYIISPALPVNPADHSVTVTNNMDFMAISKVGYQIPENSIGGTWPGTEASPLIISMPAMTRLCSAIAIRDLYNEKNYAMTVPAAGTNDYTGRYNGISIDYLCSSGNYVLGASEIVVDRSLAKVIPEVYMLPKANDDPKTTLLKLENPWISENKITYRLGTCVNNDGAKTSAYTNDMYVLPYAADNPEANNKFTIHFNVTMAATNCSVVTPLIDGNHLAPGKRTEYEIQMYFTGVKDKSPMNIDTKVKIATPIIPWIEPTASGSPNYI